MQSGHDSGHNMNLSLQLLESALKDSPDIVIFPEYQMLLPDYSDAGGTRALFEPVEGGFVSAFREFSADSGTAIMVNFAEAAGEKRYNTSLLMVNGRIEMRYRKLHLFDAYNFRESSVYDPGDGIPEPFNFMGFRIAPMICYDIRFPELSRFYEDRGADILVYQSGWYSGRNKLDLWISLLRTRSTECGCFSVGAAQCGPEFTGHTAAFSPYGNSLGELDNLNGHLTIEVHRETLETYRKDVPLREQRRPDLYSITH